MVHSRHSLAERTRYQIAPINQCNRVYYITILTLFYIGEQLDKRKVPNYRSINYIFLIVSVSLTRDSFLFFSRLFYHRSQLKVVARNFRIRYTARHTGLSPVFLKHFHCESSFAKGSLLFSGIRYLRPRSPARIGRFTCTETKERGQ